MLKIFRTAERISGGHPADNFVFQRSLLAYQRASRLISGNVLEIGTGSGYGVSLIAPNANEFWTIDKNPVEIDYDKHPNTRFICMEVPPLAGLPSAYFDYVVCFQVIEHICDDAFFMSEIHRVLKPGGKLILSTPNILKSLTRNPWHIREYTIDQMTNLISAHFDINQTLGVFGNHLIESYYVKNKRSVDKILKFDFLNLNKRLPCCFLRLPYDLANHLNRSFLHKRNRTLTETISSVDYFLKEANHNCYDLFFVASSR